MIVVIIMFLLVALPDDAVANSGMMAQGASAGGYQRPELVMPARSNQPTTTPASATSTSSQLSGDTAVPANQPPSPADAAMLRTIEVIAILFLIVSLAGLIWGFQKDGLIVFRSWGHVVLVATCLAGLFAVAFAGSLVLFFAFFAAMLLLLGGNAYVTNRNLFMAPLAALLAVVAQIFVVAIAIPALVGIIIFCLSQPSEYSRAKSREQKNNAIFAFVVSLLLGGLVGWAILKIVKQGKENYERRKDAIRVSSRFLATSEYDETPRSDCPALFSGQNDSNSGNFSAVLPNGSATASLLLGVLGLVIPVLLSIPAIAFGYVGLRRASDPRIGGRGQAFAGMFLGVLGLFLFAGVLSYFIIFGNPWRSHAEVTRPVAQNAPLAKPFEQGLSSYYTKDFPHAIAFFRQASAEGDKRAQSYLGLMYHGGLGVDRDDALALKYLTTSGDSGDLKAQYTLGVMYHDGNGVPSDFQLSVQWLKRAAEQGDADAEWELGRAYHEANGPLRDDERAVQWLKRAAGQGQTKAQGILGAMYFAGDGVSPDKAEGIRLMSLAAERGDVMAEYSVRSTNHIFNLTAGGVKMASV